MKIDYTPNGTRKNVSLRRLNRLFPHLKNIRLSRAILFKEKDRVTVVVIPNTLAKLILIILFPILAQAYFLTGNYRKFYSEVEDIFQPLKRGSFRFDVVFRSKSPEVFEKLENL